MDGVINNCMHQVCLENVSIITLAPELPGALEVKQGIWGRGFNPLGTTLQYELSLFLFVAIFCNHNYTKEVKCYFKEEFLGEFLLFQRIEITSL